jgi:hypothetical protein
MKEVIVSVLKPVAKFCFELVNKVTPDMALIIYVVLMALLALWVITLKQEGVREDGGGRYKFWQDLRTGAVVILLLQIIIYLIFR